MRKLYILGLIALAALIIGLAWAEQMTFSTYYPAPAGVYNQMVTRCLGVGDQDGGGTIDYSDAPDPSISAQENDLWVAGSVGIGTTSPDVNLHVVGDGTDSASFMNGNVGIGTTSPSANLEVDNTICLTPTDTPSHAVEGAIHYDDSEDIVKYHDDEGWKPLGGGGWTHDGRLLFNGNSPTVWTTINLNSIAGPNTLVYLRVRNNAATATMANYFFKTNGHAGDLGDFATTWSGGGGTSTASIDIGHFVYIMVETGDNGLIQWKTGIVKNTEIWLEGYFQ